MRAVTMADLLDRHVSELVSRQALEDEIDRFCRDTGRLSEMARQEKDVDTKENEVRRAQRIEPLFGVSKQLEMKEGRPVGSLHSVYEAEMRGVQDMAEEFMRQCVTQESTSFA
jgi:fructose-1,6-bisphosphatase